MKKIILETSWDDASLEDLKIAKLLKKYNLPAIFYVPVNYEKKELVDVEVRGLEQQFEIGGHTLNHANLRYLNDTTAWEEIYMGKVNLEMITTKRVKSFAYPRGKYDERIKKMVKKAGFKEARTTKVLDTDLVYDPFEKPTTIHMYPRKEYKGKPVKEIAEEYIERVASRGGRFHLWGHGWEVAKYGLWEDLEEIFNLMQKLKQ